MITPAEKSPEESVSLSRAFRLGLFQTGSALTDLLTSGIWNRILISDLGAQATPVALLSALKYLLAPLTLWIGYLSDHHRIFGRYRVPYIFIGRALVVVGTLLLPASVAGIAAGQFWGWIWGFVALLIAGVGTTASGAPFLALVADTCPYQRRGIAISIVETFLIASFSLAPPILARFIPQYEPDLFRDLAIGVAGLSSAFWLIALFRAEPRRESPPQQTEKPDFTGQFRAIFADPQARAYGVFVAVSAAFAFMQDALLEPFGGDVFGLSLGETTRFNAWWGVGVLSSMTVTAFKTRHFAPHQQKGLTGLGLAWMGITLALLGLASQIQALILVRPLLFLFGLGFGLYGIGGYNLLMTVNRDDASGAYLALWTVVQMLARGVGLLMGGVLRDAGYALSQSYALAYALLFILESLGLFTAVILLRRISFTRFIPQARD